MKKIPLIVLVSFMFLGILFLTFKDRFVQVNKNSSEQPQNETSEVNNINSGTPLNEYSIEKLRQKKFPKGEIKIISTVSKANGLVSSKVSYEVDGLTEYALMIAPEVDPPESGFPVVIVNHGHIDPDVYSTETSYINTSTYYARQGFLVLKPDYRGHDKSEGDATGFFSRINYATDVLQLLYDLDSLPKVDKDNVFMYGHSMGGDVSLRVLEASNFVKAATLWAPAVTYFPENSLYFVRKNRSGELDRRIAELKSKVREDEYDSISVVENLFFVNVPLLVQQGTADQSVPYKWGEDLVSRLKKEGKDVEFFSYTNDNHDIAGNFTTALSRDVDFFKSLIRK